MAVREPTASVTEARRLCKKCGSHELRRQQRGLADRVLSLQPYKCGRCAHVVTRLKLTWQAGLKFGLFAALIGVIVYFSLNPPFQRLDNDPQNANEALARARSAAGGQLSTFEQMMIHKPRTTLDNAKILELSRAGVDANVIMQMIRTSIPDYDLSADSIIQLKQAGVNQVVILAMIDASYNAR
jgi:hypothetical protein